ncbi:MAG: class I SAM-dependent methyltransferase [Ilumatobacteraceae bacterium]
MTNPAFPVPHFVSPIGQTSDWRLILMTDVAISRGLVKALPGTAAEIAKRSESDEHATRVVLDVLVSGGLLQNTGGIFSTSALWPNNKLAAQIHHHARSIRAWSMNIDARLDGITEMAAEPGTGPARQQLDLWLTSMAVGAETSAAEHADTILSRFPNAKRILDLGGGHGVYGREFARRGLDVVLQDRPEVLAIAKENWLKGSSVTTFAGDFFETLASGEFDVALCFGITHTFSAEKNKNLYSRIARRLSSKGGFAIQTFLRGQHPATPSFAVQMLVVGHGGDTHAEEDYRSWLTSAGFGHIETIPASEGPSHLVIGRR